MNKTVFIRVDYDEMNTRRLVKAAGGEWNKEKKLWKIAYGTALSLGLQERIVMPP
jgi:hypothetical protein